jgi:hypothetical protein
MRWVTAKIGIVIMLLFCFRQSTGQSPALAAISKICKAYNSSMAIQFRGYIKMYNKNTPAVIIETMASTYTIRKNNFSCTIGSVSMLLNEKYYVSVDKSLKIMMIGNKKDLSAIAQVPVLNIGRFAALIEDNTLTASIENRQDGTVMTLTDKATVSGYGNYSIWYEPSSGYLKKVLVELFDPNDTSRKTVVLEIRYTMPVPAAGNLLFDETDFFSIVNGKVKMNALYKSYQLINQL